MHQSLTLLIVASSPPASQQTCEPSLAEPSLLELNAVAARVGVLFCLEVVQGHAKLTQDVVAQVLQLPKHLRLYRLLALLHQA